MQNNFEEQLIIDTDQIIKELGASNVFDALDMLKNDILPSKPN